MLSVPNSKRKRNLSLESLSAEERQHVMDAIATQTEDGEEKSSSLQSLRKSLRMALPRKADKSAEGRGVRHSADGLASHTDQMNRSSSPMSRTKRSRIMSVVQVEEPPDILPTASQLSTLFYEVLTNNDSITEVSLRHCPLDDALINELLAALRFNSVVREVDLAFTSLSSNAVLQIYDMLLTNTTIIKLDLSFNQVPIGICKKAKKMLRVNTHVQELLFEEFAGLGKVRMKGKVCPHVEHICISFKPLLDANKLANKALSGQSAVLLLSDRKANAIPLHIMSLTHLAQLSLNKNRLTHLPPSISQLQQLRILDLSCNKLTRICKEVHLLPQLEVLDLSHNLLDGIPFCIGTMTSLKSLSLHHNRLSSPERLPLRMLSLSPAMKTLDITDNDLKLLDHSMMPETLWSEQLPLKRFQLMVVGFGTCGKSVLLQKLLKSQLSQELLPQEDLDHVRHNQISHVHEVFQQSSLFPSHADLSGSGSLDISSSSLQKVNHRVELQCCEVSSHLMQGDERLYYDLVRMNLPSKWTVFLVPFRLFGRNLDQQIQELKLWINCMDHERSENIPSHPPALSKSKGSPRRGLYMRSQSLTSSMEDNQGRKRRKSSLARVLPLVLVGTYLEADFAANKQIYEPLMESLRDALSFRVFAIASMSLDGDNSDTDVATVIEGAVLDCFDGLPESTMPLDRRYLWLRERLMALQEAEDLATMEYGRVLDLAKKCNLESGEELEQALQFLADQGTILDHKPVNERIFLDVNSLGRTALSLVGRSEHLRRFGEVGLLSQEVLRESMEHHFSCTEEIDAALHLLERQGVLKLLVAEGTSRLARMLQKRAERFYICSFFFITKKHSIRSHTLLTPKPEYKPLLVNFQLKIIPPTLFLSVVAEVLLCLPAKAEIEYVWREGMVKVVSQESDDQLLIRCADWQHCFAVTVWDKDNLFGEVIIDAIEKLLMSDDWKTYYTAKETVS